MSPTELIAEAKRQGYQLVPIPERVYHDFKVGDRIREVIPIAVNKNTPKLIKELLTPRSGVVIAYASCADLFVRDDNGKHWIAIARTTFGNRTRIEKVGTT